MARRTRARGKPRLPGAKGLDKGKGKKKGIQKRRPPLATGITEGGAPVYGRPSPARKAPKKPGMRYMTHRGRR